MAKRKFPRTLFLKPKDKKIARIISIKSPSRFRKSIATLKREGITTQEKRALVLARTRAKVQLRRKNLSMRERRQFKEISKTDLPPVTKRLRRRR